MNAHNRTNNKNREMWGNYLADKTAASLLIKTLYQYNGNSSIVLHSISLPSLDAPTLTPLLPPS